MQILDNTEYKIIKSPGYNSIFRKADGYFMRWGNTKDEDPSMAPGPEILDIEISTVCHGISKSPGGKPVVCEFCYKSNTHKGNQMSIDTFKKIFTHIPVTTNQIAFGIGDIYGHSDMWKIFNHCRENGMVPNITTNGYRLDDHIANRLSKVCGAVAVSRYDSDTCYGAVERLVQAGMTQVTIHQLLSVETYDDCIQVLYDMQHDSRLKGLHAVLFLALKPKGRGDKLTILRDKEKFARIIHYSLDNNLPIGFDSCTANNFLSVIKNRDDYEQLKTCVEPCESGCFSGYCDVHGQWWPCSFSEGIEESINLLEINDFNKDVWHSPEVKRWRAKLLANNRSCPIFDLELK